jgi:hypothetical protein
LIRAILWIKNVAEKLQRQSRYESIVLVEEDELGLYCLFMSFLNRAACHMNYEIIKVNPELLTSDIDDGCNI